MGIIIQQPKPVLVKSMRRFSHFLWAGAVFLLLAFSGMRVAAADEFSGLESGQFNTIADTVSALVASGNPQAGAVIDALEKRHLVYSPAGGVFIRVGSTYIDARTGQSVQNIPVDLKPVRMNNHVRQVLANANAELELLSPEDAVRLKAASQMYAQHNPVMLPAIKHALVLEKNNHVRLKLEQASAAIVLAQPMKSGEEASRLAAVKALGSAADLEARGVLAAVATSDHETAEVRKAAAETVSSIDLKQRVWSVVQNAFYGLSYGSVLLLAATGLAITFGVMGVINMAHGELMMIGAYTTWMVQQGIRATVPWLEPVSLLVAIPVAFCVCGLLGILIERGLIRFLYGRPLENPVGNMGAFSYPSAGYPVYFRPYQYRGCDTCVAFWIMDAWQCRHSLEQIGNFCFCIFGSGCAYAGYAQNIPWFGNACRYTKPSDGSADGDTHTTSRCLGFWARCWAGRVGRGGRKSD